MSKKHKRQKQKQKFPWLLEYKTTASGSEWSKKVIP